MTPGSFPKQLKKTGILVHKQEFSCTYQKTSKVMAMMEWVGKFHQTCGAFFLGGGEGGD